MRVGIIGFFGSENIPIGGQEIKTINIENGLGEVIGLENVTRVDTSGWKKKPLKTFWSTLKLINHKCIIVLPAQKGVKVFIPLLSYMKKIFKLNINYIVIGGWLPSYIKTNRRLMKFLKEFNNIFVETHSMKNNLNKAGLNNIKILPNFKKIQALKEDEIFFDNRLPLKLCTFSRVVKEKGIEDIIEAVEFFNRDNNSKIFELDIYGSIHNEYEKRFSSIIKKTSNAINYRGVADANKSVDVLKGYAMLVFPTYYEGEGFPGTIIDAFSAGVPVLASDWKYNTEIVENHKTGLIFKTQNVTDLIRKLDYVYKYKNEIINMKLNCVSEIQKYNATKVIETLINDLNIK